MTLKTNRPTSGNVGAQAAETVSSRMRPSYGIWFSVMAFSLIWVEFITADKSSQGK
jgi:hypothetical protein